MKAGYALVVHDVTRAAVEELVAEGATAGTSPRQVAETTDVLITMLPDSPQVREVYLGTDGAFEALRPGWLAIDMSSIAPSTARELAERAAAAGAEMLDAPVSGGDKGAIAGTLSIMVGGTAAAFERALPILEAMGKTIVHVGPAGAGQVVKVCNQVTVAVVIEAVSEALVLGAKAGVDPAKIADVLQGGLAATKVLELRRGEHARRHLRPGLPGPAPPEGPQERARSRPRDRRRPAGGGPGGPADAGDVGGGPGRLRPLGADHHARGPRRVPGRGRGGRGGHAA